MSSFPSLYILVFLDHVNLIVWCYLPTQWNVNALLLESAQAREDRKKRVRYLFRLLICNILPYHPHSFNISVYRKNSSDWQSFKHSMAAHSLAFNLPQEHYHLPLPARLHPSHNPKHLSKHLYHGKCRLRKGKVCRSRALGHHGLGQEWARQVQCQNRRQMYPDPDRRFRNPGRPQQHLWLSWAECLYRVRSPSRCKGQP